jgi:hypothetical protein
MYQLLRRFASGFVLSLFGLALSSGVASAANAHFINASASLGNGGTLTVSFKEAGLGDNQNVHYVASADATAQYACVNGGGRHPQATNKENVSGPVSAEGTFSSGKNGAISSSLTISPPSAGDFSCPPGQRLVFASVSYSNVAITDTTNGVSEPISGTFSQTFYTF